MSGAVHVGDRRSINEWPQFLRGLISNPRSVASLFPSSRPLARRIAEQVDPSMAGCVLELGPGTGVVTQALLERGIQASRLVLLEADPKFVKFLRRRFPDAKVLCGNALEFEHAALDQPLAAIVSGLPLLNFEERKRRAFIDRGLHALAAGGPLVQLSFGWKPPVPSGPRRAIRSAGIEFRNLPPASVWVYSGGPTVLGSSTTELSSDPPRYVSRARSCRICGAPSVESGEGHDDVRDPLCLHHLAALDPVAAEFPSAMAQNGD